jgi:hydrogenase maturation protease
LVIGCGNPLRGDDAAGCVLIHRLWERWGGAPAVAGVEKREDSSAAGGGETRLMSDVRLADAGTSGMGVVFQMREAERVILVDAARTGSPPGTVMRVPALELAPVPRAGASHEFRWDAAIGFGHWLLGPQMPGTVEAVLIEGQSFAFGGTLTRPVDRAVERVMAMIEGICGFA